MAKVKRLFFALWPDEAVRQQLAAISRQYRPEGARGVARCNLHATLVFLGSTPKELIPDIFEAAGAIQSASFTLVMQQLEVCRRPQVLCLSPETVPVALSIDRMSRWRARCVSWQGKIILISQSSGG